MTYVDDARNDREEIHHQPPDEIGCQCPRRTCTERRHEADECGIKCPQASGRNRNRTRESCDRERGEDLGRADLSRGDTHGPHDDENQNESDELIDQRGPREQPSSASNDVGGLTLECREGALDPIRCRFSKEVPYPVDRTVDEPPEPVGTGEPEDQPQRQRSDGQGAHAGAGRIEDPSRRVRCYSQQRDGSHGQAELRRKVPDAGCDDGGGDLDGGEAKGGKHPICHADRQGAPGGNRIRDRACGLYCEEAVPQSKAWQRCLVGPDAGDLIDEGDPRDGYPPPGVEVGHGCPCVGVAREFRDHFDENEDQQDEARDATEHLAPAHHWRARFLRADRHFRWDRAATSGRSGSA